MRSGRKQSTSSLYRQVLGLDSRETKVLAPRTKVLVLKTKVPVPTKVRAGSKVLAMQDFAPLYFRRGREY